MKTGYRRGTAAVVLTVSAYGVVAIGPSGSASAATISCGQTITKNTTLTQDVGPCEGDGIIVGADNIVLNLNGHRIYGTPDPGDGNAAGIRLPLRTRVTIVGTFGKRTPMGAVSDFDAGVVINGGSRNVVSKLIVEDNVSHSEADPPGSTNFTSTLGDGIVLFNSARNVIRGSIIRANGIYDNVAVLGVGSDYNVITGNQVIDSTGVDTDEFTGVGQGVILNPVLSSPAPVPTPSLYGNRMIGNEISDNEAAGITNVSNVNGEIRNNTITGNGFSDSQNNPGIDLTAQVNGDQVTNVLVSGNTISNNAGRGIGGAFADVSEGNRIVSNIVTENGHADVTQFLGFAGGGINSGSGSLVQDNTVRGNQGVGILAHGSGSTVMGNIVEENWGDGILWPSQDSSANVTAENEVHRNDGSGIAITFGDGNEFRDNDAADNMLDPIRGFLFFFFLEDSQGADLFDLNTSDFEVFDCAANIWTGNTWGAGGLFPYCVGAGGFGPAIASGGSVSISTEVAGAPATTYPADSLLTSFSRPIPPSL